MKKEDVLSEEFPKQFKTGEELYSFLAQIQKRGAEQILEGELDTHLGRYSDESTPSFRAKVRHSQAAGKF